MARPARDKGSVGGVLLLCPWFVGARVLGSLGAWVAMVHALDCHEGMLRTCWRGPCVSVTQELWYRVLGW